MVELRGTVRWGRRRSALVVRALRRGDDDEALPGAVLVALRQVAGDVAEPQRYVVAGGLRRSDELQRFLQRGNRLVQALDCPRHGRIGNERVECAEHLGQL